MLIDPMAQGAHAETDLAALGVFGQPHLEQIYAGYHEVSALADGWQERVALHQLHMVMIHVYLFGGGYGAFSANVIGRVVDVPGQPEKWEGLGLGLTWRTPWSGQLTVGAENVISRGKNPFAPNNESNSDGTIPYVRYEQDL